MKYYFIDKEIYFQGAKQPPRKVELFDVTLVNGKIFALDKDGNHYCLDKNEVFMEEEE